MSTVTLRAVTRTQGNNAALKEGAVTPAGYELTFEEVPVLVEAFRRMVRERAFDVCEMALTTYLCAKAHGKPFTALPIFLVRGFHHGAIVRHTESGIEHPQDLEGRRVGVHRGYTVTTGVWARGILADEHGVDLDRVTWAPSGDEHVVEYQPPPNVEALSPGTDFGDELASGGLAAVVGTTIDRPGIAPLLDHPEEAGYAALRREGLYPINHCIVVADDALARHPDLGAALFEAFAESKRRYVECLRADAIEEPSVTDRMHRQVMDILGGDPLPYGIGPNEAMLHKLIDHAVRQRILDTRPDLRSLFAEGTRDLVA